MKYSILLVAGVFAASLSYSQTEIKLEDVSKHIGDSVKVCGKAEGIRFLEKVQDQPTFINIGAAYPNQLLTVVIWGIVLSKFEKTPEDLFTDKEICVTGKIELYKGKPQIVILERKQVTLQ